VRAHRVPGVGTGNGQSRDEIHPQQQPQRSRASDVYPSGPDPPRFSRVHRRAARRCRQVPGRNRYSGACRRHREDGQRAWQRGGGAKRRTVVTERGFFALPPRTAQGGDDQTGYKGLDKAAADQVPCPEKYAVGSRYANFFPSGASIRVNGRQIVPEKNHFQGRKSPSAPTYTNQITRQSSRPADQSPHTVPNGASSASAFLPRRRRVTKANAAHPATRSAKKAQPPRRRA